MNVIKHTLPGSPTREVAEALLADLLKTKGALLGFVEKDNQVVAFFPDYSGDAPITPGQERVTLAFREPSSASPSAAQPEPFLQHLGEALRGKGPWAR